MHYHLSASTPAALPPQQRLHPLAAHLESILIDMVEVARWLPSTTERTSATIEYLLGWLFLKQ